MLPRLVAAVFGSQPVGGRDTCPINTPMQNARFVVVSVYLPYLKMWSLTDNHNLFWKNSF